MNLVPPLALYRGLFEFAEYAFQGAYNKTYGMTLRNLRDPGNGLIQVMIILAIEWAVFLFIYFVLERFRFRSVSIRCRRPVGSISIGHQIETAVEMEAPDVALERHQIESGTRIKDALVVCRLRKVYPGILGLPAVAAVKSLSFSVGQGQCFGLLGPNGAGKSTILNLLSGFLLPSDGSAIIDGFDMMTSRRAVFAKIGVCPQDKCAGI